MTNAVSLTLKPADKVEIISLVDNCIDHISPADKKEVLSVGKWTKEKGLKTSALPLAEHGFSMYITVYSGDSQHSILFDTGPNPGAIVTNAERMGVKLSDAEAVVLSHGHWDHAGGLVSAVKAIGKTDLPVLVHEDMFKTRGMALSDGTVRRHKAFPSPEEVKPARYVATKEPYLLAEDTVMVTGEIPHQTSFEKGLPEHRTLMNGAWVPEPWLQDDRALIINVKGKGLVVLSGCGHAGIINTILYAKQLTGIAKVYAILGGFHLAGKGKEETIRQTVEELKNLNPEVIVPSHCTGWKGNYIIYQVLPDVFVWNSVGNLYRFE